MTTVATSQQIASGSGNTAWSAKSTFYNQTGGPYIQQPITGSSSPIGSANSSLQQAQAFTPRHDITFSTVWFLSSTKTGTPADNITLTVQTDSSNKPSGSVVTNGTATPFAAGSITASTWWQMTFASPVSLTANTQYWLVMGRSGAVNGSNFISWVRTATDVYASNDRSTSSSGTWTSSSSGDFTFAVIADTVTRSAAYYQVTQNTALHVWKSTDGTSWAEQDAAHAPTVSNSAYPFSADDSPYGTIACAYFTATNTLRTRIFDTTTDLWDSADHLALDMTTDADNLSPVRVVYTAPTFLHVHYTSVADDADLSIVRRSSPTAFAISSILAATSGERSIVADTVSDSSLYSTAFHYDTANDDFTARTFRESIGNASDLDTTAAADETKHASSTYQVYAVSGVDTVTAAYIDSDDTLDERTVTLTTSSTTPQTYGTQHQITATSYAGRQISTCKYGADRYVFVNTATAIDVYIDAGDTGSWGSVTHWKTGLTSCALSRAIAVPSVGVLVSYMDNGNVIAEWAVDGPSGGTAWTGSVAIAAQSAVTVSGIASHVASLTVAAVSALSIAGAAAHPGSVAVAASSTVSIAGTVRRTGAVTVAATSTVTITGAARHTAAASIPATSAVAIAATAAYHAAVTVPGTSTVSVRGTTAHTATVTIPATSSVSIDGMASHTGSVAIVAQSAVSVSGSTSNASSGAVAIAAISTVSIAGTVAHTGSIALAATSTVAVTGAASHTGAVAVAGQSTVTILAVIDVRGVVTIAGAATVLIAGATGVTVPSVIVYTAVAAPRLVASSQATTSHAQTPGVVTALGQPTVLTVGED